MPQVTRCRTIQTEADPSSCICAFVSLNPKLGAKLIGKLLRKILRG